MATTIVITTACFRAWKSLLLAVLRKYLHPWSSGYDVSLTR